MNNSRNDQSLPEDSLNHIIDYPFQLDSFQLESEDNIKNFNSILVCAHTSSGKTVAAEMAIQDSINKNKKVIYTSPIKTLSNQKYREFTKTFNRNFGLLTGDLKCNIDADCVIMTTEILRNKLFQNPEEFEDVIWVIFDEVHYVNDKNRGAVWEDCILKLPEHIRLVMLSATLSNPNKFASWINKNRPNDNIKVIETDKRPVPLYFNLLDNNNKRLVEVCNTDTNEFNKKLYEENIKANNKVSDAIEYVTTHELNPSLFFVLSRQRCHDYAGSLQKYYLTPQEQAHIEDQYVKYVHEYAKKVGVIPNNVLNMRQLQEMKMYILHGVAVHHAGLLPFLKEIVEMLYSDGLLKILFATETFAMGVNMPTKSVVYMDLEKFSGDQKDFLTSDEFNQMSGEQVGEV